MNDAKGEPCCQEEMLCWRCCIPSFLLLCFLYLLMDSAGRLNQRPNSPSQLTFIPIKHNHMHVAINAYFWNQPHTGSGQYTRQLVYHFNRFVSDLKVTLIYPHVDDSSALTDVPPSVYIHGVPTRPGNLGKVIFEQSGFPRACKAVGADIAHVPYWGSPLRSPVPIVVTIHDLITLIFREYHHTAAAKLYNALISASARGASHIITDSDASKADIVKWLEIPEKEISTVYLAPSPDFSPDGNLLLDMAVRQKYDLPDFYNLYLGGYTLHKNVTTLLLAYTYVKTGLGEDYPLILAGKKPESTGPHIPDYDTYIKKLGLENDVRWIGYVDEEDKAILYREAETFIFPSRYEGFGLPPLEAMACGTPVVTTIAPGISEVVGDAAMAVNPDEEKRFGGAIIATVLQENLREDLKQKGFEQVKKYSWEKTAGQTVAIYADVLEKK